MTSALKNVKQEALDQEKLEGKEISLVSQDGFWKVAV